MNQVGRRNTVAVVTVAVVTEGVELGNFEIGRFLHLKSKIRNLRLDWPNTAKV
jgi:hypothetical protein